MEELLNELIKRWWKPFNVDCAWTNVEVINRLRDNQYLPEHTKIIFKTENHWHVFDCNIRDLVSKSSWLWQFCCKNKLLEHWFYTRAKWQRRKKYDDYWKRDIPVDKPEYRVIESSLIDESELEYFLISHIKVVWK
jgi:hypothetical protein